MLIPRISPCKMVFGQLAVLLLLLWLLSAMAAPVSAAPMPQAGGPGEQIFQAQCAACHTIGGGKLVGPDLKGVTERTDPQWLHSFILDPNKMFAANDPTALQLLAEYNNIKMPTLGLSDADVDAVIGYLQLAGTASGSGAAPVSTQPAAPPGDPAVGQRLFTGEQPLANGGPACLACHSVSGTGVLGGGALGPDLTHAFQRFNGSTGLTPVLTNIAFPTMIGPFAGHALTPTEVADLVAFFEQEDTRLPPVTQIAPGSLTPNLWRLVVIALVGGIALTVLMLVFWPRQRQSISARLRSTARRRDI